MNFLEETLMLNLLYIIMQKTEADFKNATGADPSKIASKSDLTISKGEIDKIDVDKLNIVPDYLSKLSNIVDNKVVKKLYIINWLQK